MKMQEFNVLTFGHASRLIERPKESTEEIVVQKLQVCG